MSDLKLAVAVAIKVAGDQRNKGCHQPDWDVLENAHLMPKEEWLRHGSLSGAKDFDLTEVWRKNVGPMCHGSK